MPALTKAPSPAEISSTTATTKVLAVSRRHFTTSFAALAGAASVLGLAACGGGGGGSPAAAPGAAGAPGASPAPEPGATPAPASGAGRATLTLIAGQARVPSNLSQVNGTGAAANLGVIRGMSVQNDGTVWVSDDYNYTLHRITSAGVVTTPYGKARVEGLTNGVGEAALFKEQGLLCVDESTGSAILTAGQGSQAVLRTMNVTTLGTTSDIGRYGIDRIDYSDGPITARAIVPSCIATGKPEAGKPVVWVADLNIYGPLRIRKIYDGSITTIVSDAGSGYIDDMVINAAGELFVSQNAGLFGTKISKVTGSALTLVAGGKPTEAANPDNLDVDGTGAAASIGAGTGLSIDKTTGNMFVASTGGLRQITPAGVVTTLLTFQELIDLGTATQIDYMVCVAPKQFITASRTAVYSFVLA